VAPAVQRRLSKLNVFWQARRLAVRPSLTPSSASQAAVIFDETSFASSRVIDLRVSGSASLSA